MLKEVALTALHVLFESLGRKNILVCQDSVVGQESECRAINLENSADCFALENAVLQVTVLLPVQVFFALWRHLVGHVSAQSAEVSVQVAWVGVDDPVHEESDEITLA